MKRRKQTRESALVEVQSLLEATLRLLAGFVRMWLPSSIPAKGRRPPSRVPMRRVQVKPSSSAISNRRSLPSLTVQPMGDLQANELANAFETFTGYSRCFSLDELMQWLDSDANRDTVQRSLLDDPRFKNL